MNRFRYRIAALALCLCALFLLLPLPANAAQTAEDITDRVEKVDQKGFSKARVIYDGDQLTTAIIREGSYLTMEYGEGIGSLYLIFDIECGAYTVTNNDTGETSTWGENGFLHEFVDLKEIFSSAPKSVTITFDGGQVRLNELYVFSRGEVPDFVQKWEQPAEGETDLVLFSTHGDDEQLFFAGVLPYYAGELGYEVQVVYLTNHRNRTTDRCHEMLNGLWAVGVTNYPVFGQYGDYYTTTAQKALNIYIRKNITEEELVGYVVEQLRRFKPLVAVGHDLVNGEYGHGQHMLYAQLLTKALEICNDPTQYPETAEKYGVWDVPKTYLHLWPENEIIMDWDQPLKAFDGLTAYQVTKYRGFPCHASQYQDFAWYIVPYDTAAAVQKYNPCYYGLYRSTVGQDVAKNDFFENLRTYAQQKQDEETAAEEARLDEVRQAVAQAREVKDPPNLRPTEAAPSAPEPEVKQNPGIYVDKRLLLAVILGAMGIFTLVEILKIWRKEKNFRKNEKI